MHLGQLHDLVRQIEISGASRRAAILHIDRLPQALARMHHVRLAREAVRCLAGIEHARCFELSRGRIAIVWRGECDAELAAARDALDHLLSGQPAEGQPHTGGLLTLYDLPAQALWLLDEADDLPVDPDRPRDAGRPMDLALLARLEVNLAQADLARFSRRRAIMMLPTEPDGAASRSAVRPLQDHPAPAWTERYFALDDIADTLCPGRSLRFDPWLLRRLTRTLDRRMLAMLTTPHEIAGQADPCPTFAINLNVATILAPAFIAFDQTLPAPLRGRIILNLRAADILCDATSFGFARRFAEARGYRLALAGATPGLLRFFDAAAAGISVVHVALTAEVQARPELLHVLLAADIAVVLTGLHRSGALRWAVQQGVCLGRGRALNW